MVQDDSCGIRGVWLYLLELLLYEIITNRETESIPSSISFQRQLNQTSVFLYQPHLQ